MRGKKAEVGDERVSPNGYQYTRTDTGWRLSHHIVAEKFVIFRPLKEGERVEFVGPNKLDLSPDNIRVVPKGRGSLRRRKAALEDRIRELQAELEAVNAELLA